MNWELPDKPPGFRKGRTRDQIANIHWVIETAREFQENISFCFIDYAKDFVWIRAKCGKFLKRWEYQTTWPASWETSLQVQKQQLEPDMEGWLGKEYVKAVCCHSAYLTSMQSTSHEMLGWMKQKLELRLPGEISITSDMQMTPLDVGERGEWKIWLKTQHSKNEDHGIWFHHFMANRWQDNGNSVRFNFLGLQSHSGWWLQPWN